MLKIVLIYAFFGCAWIYFSDAILGWLVHDQVHMTRISMSKGLMFIVITAALLFVLISRYAQRSMRVDGLLRESEERYRILAENARDVIWVFDLNLNYIYVSPSILQLRGYTVLAVRKPDQAIILAGEHDEGIDLLLTDVVMPDMNGRELAGRLVSVRPGMKCLYMSGYTANVIAHHGILDQGVHFLPKPFSLKELAEKVREVLEQH